MTWGGAAADWLKTTAALTDDKTTYAAEVKLISAVALSAGTGYYAERDAAYLEWQTAADVTAVAQKNWDLAKVEKLKLDCLATSDAAHASTVNGVACESQTHIIKDLKATRDSLGITTGWATGSVKTASTGAATFANAGTWVAAVLPTGTGKIEKVTVLTPVEVNAATADSKLKAYMLADRNKAVSAEHKKQSGLDSAAAIAAKGALEMPLAALKATVSVKEYLEKIESDKEAVFKADKLKYENATLKKHREDEATQAGASATLAKNAVAAYASDAGTTLAAWNLATARSTALGVRIKAEEVEKAAGEADLKLATSNCKAAGW